jgi:hypothetical protein
VNAALFTPAPKPPNVGRSLAQAEKAAWYCAGMLGRVKPPGGADPPGVDPLDVDPLGVDPLDVDPPDVELGLEPDEPDPERRPPNSEPVALAGTPWPSRHWVYLARAAELGPPFPPAPAPDLDVDGAVVVGEAVALLEPPPQAVSSPARARRGRMNTAPRTVARFERYIGGVTSPTQVRGDERLL